MARIKQPSAVRDVSAHPITAVSAFIRARAVRVLLARGTLDHERIGGYHSNKNNREDGGELHLVPTEIVEKSEEGLSCNVSVDYKGGGVAFKTPKVDQGPADCNMACRYLTRD